MSFVRVAFVVFFFQAEDGIRDLVRSRGLGDVYKRQVVHSCAPDVPVELLAGAGFAAISFDLTLARPADAVSYTHLTLPTIYSV